MDVLKQKGRINHETSLALAALFCWLATVMGAAAAPSFTAKFNREFLQVGQPGVLSLTFEENAPTDPPQLPEIAGAQTYFNGQQQQWTSINGIARVSRSFNYIIIASKAGELTVPAIQATVNGRVVTSEPVTIKVLTPDQIQGAEQELLSKLAFIRITLPKAEAYVGEVVPAQIKVYAVAADQLQLHQFKAEGFTLGKASHTTQGRELVDNQMYYVVTFHMPIAARMIGRLPVGPAECTLNVQLPPALQNRNDPFAQADIFGRGQIRAMRITSEVEHLNVLPLPTNNVPANFNGAVGSFQMNVTANPTNLPAGDPISYVVDINATGTLDDLNLPPQQGWREFKTYPATSEILTKDPLGTSGVKRFEQIVVPTHTEIKELPPFAFSYFDPDLRQYRTITQPAIPLTITPGSNPMATPSYIGGGPANQPEPELKPEDIAHIEPRLGSSMTGSVVLIRQPWFFLLQLVPVGGWLAVLIWKRNQERLKKDPRKQRERQVARLVASGLHELKRLADQGDTEAFHETTLRLLKEQIGERLDLPAVSITEEVIDDRLRPAGLPAESSARLHALFQNCNHARYAGEVSTADLQHSLNELETALQQLTLLPAV